MFDDDSTEALSEHRIQLRTLRTLPGILFGVGRLFSSWHGTLWKIIIYVIGTILCLWENTLE